MKYKIKLSPALLQELTKRLKGEKGKKIYKRLQCIRMKHYGSGNQDISHLLGINHNTATEWAKLFLGKGFCGLCSLRYEGRRKSKLDPHREAIKSYIEEKMPSTLAELNGWLEKKYGFKMEETWLSRYCKKNSLFPAKKHALFRVRRPA
jgi:transposase